MSVDQPTKTSGRFGRRRVGPGDDPAAVPSPVASSGAAPTQPQPPRLPGRRNPKWIALGIVATCLGGLLAYTVYGQVSTETSVVAVAQTVHRGETVEAADLTTVTLGGRPGVSTVPADQLPGLVGKRAVYDLVAGAVLPEGAVGPFVTPTARRALVGVKLTAGRAPTAFLVPGSTVRLVAVPPANADPKFTDAYAGKTYPAKVVAQREGPDAASVLVDVDVESTQAPVIALLSAQDRLTIVRDADG